LLKEHDEEVRRRGYARGLKKRILGGYWSSIIDRWEGGLPFVKEELGKKK